MLTDLGIAGDEPEDIFPAVLDRVDELASIVPGTGGVLHLCNVGLVGQAFVRGPLLGALARPRDHPVLLGYHVNYDHGNLPLAPGFIETFKNAAQDATGLDVDALVLHAPLITTSDTDASFIAEVTSEPFIDAMRGCTATLCWENAQDPVARYKRLDRLIAWRERLVEELERLGHGDIASRHRFCLDTGHLLLAVQRDGIPASHVVEHLPAFGEHVKVFHLHANDGTADQHVIPFLDTRGIPTSGKIIDQSRLDANSEIVLDWLRTCNEHAAVARRHVHLEAAAPAPFPAMVHFFQRVDTM